MSAYGASSDSTTDPSAACSAAPFSGQLELRIGAIFVILATSLLGTMFPIVSRRVRSLRVPEIVFQGTRFFGSGVIIATAFIHLLAPAFAELTAPCLSDVWASYPFASAFAMCSVFAIFCTEFLATRAGASYLRRKQLKSHDPHSQEGNHFSHTMHGAHVDISPGRTEAGLAATASTEAEDGDIKATDHAESHDHESDEIDSDAISQLIGVMILEFGVIFHSMVIGLTLAVVSDFNTLFVVLVFHQTFEGLGLGSRLSLLKLPARYRWVPFVGAGLYASITPLGLAIGLGLRETYNPNSPTANIVSGVLDSLSAGILLYTGLVELLAHDFIFSREMVEASNKKVAFSLGMVIFGAAVMALLGRWA